MTVSEKEKKEFIRLDYKGKHALLFENLKLLKGAIDSNSRKAYISDLEELIKFEIENGIDPNYALGNSVTPMIFAANIGNVAIMKKLIEKGGNVNCFIPQSKNTPLLLASNKGHFEMVKLLIENGANIDFQQKDGYTALYIAANNNEEKIVKYLIEKGANYHIRDYQGLTAKDRAEGGSYSIINSTIKSKELELEYVAYENFINLKDKQKLLGGQYKGEIGELNGETFVIKPMIAEEYFATRLLNHLNPELFQNLVLVVQDNANSSKLNKVNTILTANKFIKSFVPMTRIDTYGDSPEEMYLYITLIANYGINMGLGDDLSYDNYGYVIDNYGKKKAFVLDHEIAFNRLGESYYGLSNILYPIDHKSAIIEDKMWKDTVSKKELSFISKFTKHCSKIFSNCKSAKITSAIKKMHSEVLSREVELHAFFDMKSIKDIIQKDEDASYPRIHYHSYEDVVKFTETLSEIVDRFDSTKVDL